jgi:uncharacterized protein with ParB-like and HNH nuclease domain
MANFEKTDSFTLHDLCATYGKFSIPNFQRAYDWGNKQIVELWSSLDSSDDEKYFIGNIVCIRQEDDAERLALVDGQQRLTTLSLALIAIRDTYKDISNIKDPELKRYASQASKRLNFYLTDVNREDPEDIFIRLELGKREYQEAYEALIYEDEELYENNFNNKKYKALSNQAQKYIKNYKIIKKLTKDLVDDRGAKGLKEFEKKIKSCQFIAIICESENDVYRIFEGLNSTGLGLSVADLVKNSILQSTSSKAVRETVEYTWMEMEGNFDKTSRELFPKFLRYHWMSTQSYVSISSLFESIKKQHIKNKESHEIKEYVENLYQESLWYLGIRYSLYESCLGELKIVRDELIKFRLLGRYDQANPVLLLYLRKYLDNRKIFTAKHLRNSINQLWIFMFRARFVSVSPSKYEKVFANHCKNLNKAKTTEAVESELNRFNKELKPMVTDKEQVCGGIVDLEYSKDSALLTHILRALLERKGPKSHKHNIDSLEHILPQSPEKNWGLKKEEVASYVEKIGNLTLLDANTENPSASNKSFDDKLKNVYLKSPFKLNKEIENWRNDFNSDPEAAIQKRSEELAFEIEKIFTIH